MQAVYECLAGFAAVQHSVLVSLNVHFLVYLVVFALVVQGSFVDFFPCWSAIYVADVQRFPIAFENELIHAWPVVFAGVVRAFLVALSTGLIHAWPAVFAVVVQLFLVAFLVGLIHAWPVVFVHGVRVSRYLVLVALLCFYLLGYLAYGLTVALFETPYSLSVFVEVCTWISCTCVT